MTASRKQAGRRKTLPRSRRKPRYRLFHQTAELLQQLLPAQLPIDIRLGWVGPSRLGFFRPEEPQYQIRVSSRLSELFAIEILIHEYAHALAWPQQDSRDTVGRSPKAHSGYTDHDSAWGRAYAKVYRTVAYDIWPRIYKAELAARRLKRKGRRA